MWRKLQAILNLEPIAKPKTLQKKGPKEKTDKADQLSATSSKASRKTFSINTADTLLGIPEEMIVQVIHCSSL